MSEFLNINKLNVCNALYNCYKTLLNAYVCDFYSENHWEKLPENWKEFSKSITIEDIGELLDVNKSLTRKVYPLSLLIIRQLVRDNTLPRIHGQSSDNSQIFPCVDNLTKYLWKNVKLKKRHEITEISKVCYKTALQSNCKYVVDIGAGLGHLSRMLSYGYGLKICTLEANPTLVKNALELDEKFERILKAKSITHASKQRNQHRHLRVETDVTAENFLSFVLSAFEENNQDLRFGIVGLHPCGDLGATLLRLYIQCPNVVFINVIGCCYMKLSLAPAKPLGFPLSDYCKNNSFSLNYITCELACHAMEVYVEKLLNNNYVDLKVHAYRAALEQLLVTVVDKNLKHVQLNSAKYEENLTFQSYCTKMLEKVQIIIPHKHTEIYQKIIDETWTNVVLFYSLRLLLAPVIETIILLDRYFYVKETIGDCEILTVFNSKISPRNHVITSVKSQK